MRRHKATLPAALHLVGKKPKEGAHGRSPSVGNTKDGLGPEALVDGVKSRSGLFLFNIFINGLHVVE